MSLTCSSVRSEIDSLADWTGVQWDDAMGERSARTIRDIPQKNALPCPFWSHLVALIYFQQALLLKTSSGAERVT
jgi:hypothetical protein